MAEPTEEQYRTWAKAGIGKSDEITIDSNAAVELDGDGAWVQAWVWVARPDDDEA